MSFIENATKSARIILGLVNALVFSMINLWVAFHWDELFNFDNPTHVLVLLLLLGYVFLYIYKVVSLKFLIKKIIRATKESKKAAKSGEETVKIIEKTESNMKNYIKDIDSQIKTFHNTVVELVEKNKK